MTRWEQFEAFVRVVEAGSFTGAARMMNVSKSLLSRRVSELEAAMGAQLLYRTTRQVRVTDAGSTFFDKCRHILHQIEDAERMISSLDIRPRGRLRVAASDTFAEQVIAPLTAEFMAANPDIEIELHITSRYVDLIAEGFDVAIRFGEQGDSSLLSKKIHDLPHAVVGSRTYLARRGRPQTLEDLQDHDCLLGTLDACSAWEFITPEKQVSLKLTGRWCSNNGPALIAACREGLGLCRLPELYLRPYIDSGELVPVLEDFGSPPFPVWAIYANHQHVAARVRAFVGYLKANLPRVEARSAARVAA